MRKLNFYQNEEKQVCRVEFGNLVITARAMCDKECADLEFTECINKVESGENSNDIDKYNDRIVHFEFNSVESIETVIGWLGNLRNEFIKVKEYERK